MTRLSRIILAADLVGVIFSLLIAFTVRNGPGWLFTSEWSAISAWVPAFLAVCAIWPVIYLCLNLDGFRDGWHLPSITSNLTLGVVILISSLFALGYVTQRFYSRVVLGCFAVTVLCVFLLIRLAARTAMSSVTRSRGRRKAVIVGNGNVAHELARKIQRHPELMLEFAGFLFPTGSESPGSTGDLSATGLGGKQNSTSIAIPDLLRSSGIEELIVCLPDAYAAETQKLVSSCRKKGIHISLVPQWYELYLSKARLRDIEGLPLVSLQDHAPTIVSFVAKRAVDFVLAPVLVVLSAPVIGVCSAALRIRKGRGLVRETRCGLNGKHFRMWRLNVDRAAPADAIEESLLNFSITELPQLWNVLSGDMTLVGPRPESPARVQRYSDWQRQRLSVFPGITGMAQVYGLRDLHSSEEKARFDLQYIYHWSPLVDLALLLQTGWTVITRLPRRERRNVPVTVAKPISTRLEATVDSVAGGDQC